MPSSKVQVVPADADASSDAATEAPGGNTARVVPMISASPNGPPSSALKNFPNPKAPRRQSTASVSVLLKAKAKFKQKRPKTFKDKCRDFWTSNGMEVVMMLLTIFALYGADAHALHGTRKSDSAFGWISAITMLIFFSELVVFSWCKPKYFLGPYFWLDFIAAASLLGDIPVFMELVTNAVSSKNSGFAAARAGRASRAGTRASRIVRVIRLIRLTRMIKLLQAYKKRAAKRRKTMSRLAGELVEEEAQLNKGEKRADSITESLSVLTTSKVIIGLLMMLLWSGFMDTTPPNNTFEEGLNMLDHSITAIRNATTAGAHQCTNATGYNAAWADSATGALDFCQSDSLEQQMGYDFTVMIGGFPVLFLRLDGEEYTSLDGTVPDMGRIDTLRESEVREIILYDAESLEVQNQDEVLECEDARYCMIVDYKEMANRESVSSIYTTSWIIVLLIGGMLMFNRDSNKLSSQITRPMVELSAGLKAVARLDFSKDKFLRSSTVHEIRMMQRAFLQMKIGLYSFAKYAPRNIVMHLLESNQAATVGVVEHEISVFFSHITDFEHLCEEVQPELLLDLLAQYFDGVTHAIQQTNGTLLDFIGDMVLAIWNAPRKVSNHEYWCVESALLMIDHLAQNEKILHIMKEHHMQPMRLSAGINSARVFVGNVGSHVRMKYSVLGDGVNLASRVGELNRRYKTCVLVSEMTKEIVKEEFLLRNCDCVTVKGKSVGVKVFEVVGRMHAVTDHQKSVAKIHNNAMDMYFDRKFRKAIEIFEELRTVIAPSDRQATMMHERCKNFIQNPPPDNWDGADVLRAKHF